MTKESGLEMTEERVFEMAEERVFEMAGKKANAKFVYIVNIEKIKRRRQENE